MNIRCLKRCHQLLLLKPTFRGRTQPAILKGRLFKPPIPDTLHPTRITRCQHRRFRLDMDKCKPCSQLPHGHPVHIRTLAPSAPLATLQAFLPPATMRPQPQFPVHPRFRFQSRAGFGVIEEQIVGIAVRIDLGGPNQIAPSCGGLFWAI